MKLALSVKVQARADRVYRRRTSHELESVLSVVQGSQPVDRAENLEYRLQLVQALRPNDKFKACRIL
jgi:hypothetical protein